MLCVHVEIRHHLYELVLSFLFYMVLEIELRLSVYVTVLLPTKLPLIPAYV